MMWGKKGKGLEASHGEVDSLTEILSERGERKGKNHVFRSNLQEEIVKG